MIIDYSEKIDERVTDLVIYRYIHSRKYTIDTPDIQYDECYVSLCIVAVYTRMKWTLCKV